MAETITSDTYSVRMDDLSYSRTQSAVNNSINEWISSDGTTVSIAGTSSPPPPPSAAAPTDRRPIYEPEIVVTNPVTDAAANQGRANRVRGRDRSPVTGDDGRRPQHLIFTNTALLSTLFSIVLYIWDVGSDAKLAFNYCLNEQYWYFALTLTFILLPSLIAELFIHDLYDLERVGAKLYPLPIPTMCERRTRIVFIWLHLGPLYQYYDILINGLRSRDPTRSARIDYGTSMWFKKAGMIPNRLTDCFMESAPQLLLQLYIMTNADNQYINIWTVVGVMGSLSALSWSLVMYESNRICQKRIMSKPEFSVKFIWRIFAIASRVLALSLFASIFPVYFGAILCGQWFITFIYLGKINIGRIHFTMRALKRKQSQLINAAWSAYMLIFCFHKPGDRHIVTMHRFIYYPIVFIENCILMAIWYAHCPDDRWYKSISMYTHFGCFFLGISVMGVYYLWVRFALHRRWVMRRTAIFWA